MIRFYSCIELRVYRFNGVGSELCFCNAQPSSSETSSREDLFLGTQRVWSHVLRSSQALLETIWMDKLPKRVDGIRLRSQLELLECRIAFLSARSAPALTEDDEERRLRRRATAYLLCRDSIYLCLDRNLGILTQC